MGLGEREGCAREKWGGGGGGLQINASVTNKAKGSEENPQCVNSLILFSFYCTNVACQIVTVRKKKQGVCVCGGGGVRKTYFITVMNLNKINNILHDLMRGQGNSQFYKIV